MCRSVLILCCFFFFFQAEDGIRDYKVTGSSDVCSSDLFSRVSSIANLEKIWRMIHGSVRPANSIPENEPDTPNTLWSAARSAFMPAPPEWRIVPSMSQSISSFCISCETSTRCERLGLVEIQHRKHCPAHPLGFTLSHENLQSFRRCLGCGARVPPIFQGSGSFP